ncbi:MAG: cell division protein ZipA [Proteobacteria bacterium]|jgi:cell division protein ZipA|nr:cell division protein ZipA [Pseudomonadota bacterium]MDA1301038.1 cell division protein ZipA [Pseudomonadota bacterium]
MDFDLRQWLLILGPIFIAGVLLHGYWRMRNNRNGLRIALDKSFTSKPGEAADLDDFALLKAELPNGGARVIRKPEQTSLGLTEDIPMLMEPVANEGTEGKEAGEGNARTEAGEASKDASPRKAIASKSKDTPITANPDDRLVGQGERAALPDQFLDPSLDPLLDPLPDPLPEKAPPARASESPRSVDAQKPEKFMIVNVLASGDPFKGEALQEILRDGDMTFGEMNIFHRLDDQGFSEFSLANAVEPGVFDLASLEHLETPGVTLFLRVHELANPMHAFEEMLDVASSIADELGGVLYDESRSVMTAQTIEHSRQGIRDFLYRHSA